MLDVLLPRPGNTEIWIVKMGWRFFDKIDDRVGKPHIYRQPAAGECDHNHAWGLQNARLDKRNFRHHKDMVFLRKNAFGAASDFRWLTPVQVKRTVNAKQMPTLFWFKSRLSPIAIEPVSKLIFKAESHRPLPNLRVAKWAAGNQYIRQAPAAELGLQT